MTYVTGIRHEFRAASMVWRREMIRAVHDRARIVVMLLQPMMFLFVMGSGLAGVVDTGGGVDFRTFLFPGVLAMSVVFSASFAGLSLVWDREFGFMREMLVAPVSRAAITLGKCAGGATTSTISSMVLLLTAGLAGVPYDPMLLLELLALLFLASFMLTALGILIAARIKRMQTAMPLSQLAITPMMFLSGALFPLQHLPDWLAVLTKLNPLTYVVQPMRTAVFAQMDGSSGIDTGIWWWGWNMATPWQILVAGVVTLLILATGIATFDRTE